MHTESKPGRVFISKVIICPCLPEAISTYTCGPDINIKSVCFFLLSNISWFGQQIMWSFISLIIKTQNNKGQCSFLGRRNDGRGWKQCFRKISVVMASKKLRESERQELKSKEPALTHSTLDSNNESDKRRVQDISQG